jgi:hypothetical protein
MTFFLFEAPEKDSVSIDSWAAETRLGSLFSSVERLLEAK